MVLSYNIDGARKCNLFTVCSEQTRSPYTEHAASGLPNPTPCALEVGEGGGRYDLSRLNGPAGVTTHSPR